MTNAQRIGRLPILTNKTYVYIFVIRILGWKWVSNALNEFDSSKIKYYNPLNKTYE